MKEKTSKELVRGAFESRLQDIRIFLNPLPSDAEISEDKKWLLMGDVEIDINDLGVDLDDCLDDDGDLNPCEIAHQSMLNNNNIAEELTDRFGQYGLSFDYVEPVTTEKDDTLQHRDYYRYQISWGGPSEEFRFYVNNENELERAQFWYFHWCNGASVECTADETVLALFYLYQEILEFFKEAA